MMDSHIFNETDARNSVVCPVARVFGGKVQTYCRGGDCAVWRWKPLDVNEPGFLAAIQNAMQPMDKETGLPVKPGKDVSKDSYVKRSHKDAVAFVSANRESLGLKTKPDTGWCGLGGQVHV